MGSEARKMVEMAQWCSLWQMQFTLMFLIFLFYPELEQSAFSERLFFRKESLECDFFRFRSKPLGINVYTLCPQLSGGREKCNDNLNVENPSFVNLENSLRFRDRESSNPKHNLGLHVWLIGTSHQIFYLQEFNYFMLQLYLQIHRIDSI